ncbi:MAG TPA: hypothetical protein DCZ80_01290 [Legionellales bacterium]|nr:hypothetical protein [Legionellales bacterium]
MQNQRFEQFKVFMKPVTMGFLHLAHRLMYPMMILVITYALLVSFFTALTPWARTYKQQITAILNQKAHQTIEIEDIQTSWYGWYPVLKLMHVKMIPPEGQALECDECWIGLDVIRTLLYWHLHPGMLYIDGLDLHIIQKQDHWEIQGASQFSSEQSMQSDPALVLGKLISFAPERVLLKNIQLSFHPLSKKIYDFKNIRLLGIKKAGNYHWSVQSSFGQNSLLKVRIDMPLLSNLALPQNGNMYIEIEDLDLTTLPAYKQYIQDKQFSRFEGILNGTAWVDWNKGRIDMIQSQIELKNGVIQSIYAKKTFIYQLFQANCLWKKRTTGWEVAMDKLNLESPKLKLENDKFLWFFQSDWNTYHIYLKDLPLNLLRKIKEQLPPKALKNVLFLPDGELKEVQLNFKDGQLDYFITQFQDFSWEAFGGYPGVSGLNGVLSWEPGTAHLEISSPNFILKPKGTGPLVFDNFQTVLTVQKNQAGVSSALIEKLILARSDLALTMSGQIDEPLIPAKRNFLLQMNWSAENAHQWLKYLNLFLPESGLRKWLQEDVKKIKQTSGSMVLNGLWKDFPFEKNQGEFTINSHLYGVDLIFAKDWPLTTGIDANLKVNQRNLEAFIDKASLGALPVSQLHLSAPNLGLGKEVILVHGLIQNRIQNLYQYLLSTPLKDRAQNWLIYEFKGRGTLDLKLDIPLYKERDEIFVDGRIKVDEQPLNLNIFSQPLHIENCKGYLDFNGNGLYGGKLKGRVGADYFNLNIEHHPLAGDTQLFVQGQMEVDELKKAWNITSSDIIQGHLPIEGVISLPHGQVKNWEMQWKSPLKGVTINLPSPWNKSAQEEKPLEIDMVYHENHGISMDVLYQQKNWKIDYDKKTWHFVVAEPELMGDIYYHVHENELEAKLSRLYLDDKLLNKKEDEKSPAWKIQDMLDLKIQAEDFHYNNLNLGELFISAKKVSNEYVVEELKVSSPAYAILLHGNWTQKNLKNHIKFVGQMMISNLSKLLVQWGITPVADTRNGYIEFNGFWNEALNKISLKSLKGSLDIKLKKGNISHFDAQTEQKIGLGKLLSILSLQTLPRRLQLDFSDLATSGFAYDIFKGHFDLDQGLLHTKDSQLDGPIAHVKLQGNLNVLDRWYDLELQVYPYITASLPVVATIAGGPLAGVATWAANHVINKGMQQISGYTYKITGPWKEPVVQQVNLMRKKNDSTAKTND